MRSRIEAVPCVGPLPPVGGSTSPGSTPVRAGPELISTAYLNRRTRTSGIHASELGLARVPAEVARSQVRPRSSMRP